MELLTLPPEIISNILSYLPLEDLLPITLLCKSLRSLSSHTSYTPFPTPISILLTGPPPYTPILSKLAGYSHVPSKCFIEVLVRADTRWILEKMEVPRLGESVWKEVCERRFLGSWKRYKEEGKGDTWRATYFRIIRRLQHRTLGCTHEEAWTRFIILHRNGTASLNRIYSRGFDPLEIFREIKQQNNFASQPTQIRLVLQLQDVRIIAIGVLFTPQSLFINANAHRLLHPPLLDRMTDVSGMGMGMGGLRRVLSDGDDVEGQEEDWVTNGTGKGGGKGKGKMPERRMSDSAAAVLLFNGNTSGTTTGGPLMNGPYARSRDPVSTTLATPAPLPEQEVGSSRRPRLNSTPSRTTREKSPPIQPFLTGGIGGGGRTIALASNLARSLRMGTNNGSGGNATGSVSGSGGNRSRAATVGGSNWITDGGEATITTGRSTFGRQGRMSRLMRTVSRDRPEVVTQQSAAGQVGPLITSPSLPEGSEGEVTDPFDDPGLGLVEPRAINTSYRYAPEFTDHRSQPYRPMTHPQPAPSHRFYPNYTPPPLPPPDTDTDDPSREGGYKSTVFDTRATHPTTSVERTRMSFGKMEQGEEGMARWAEAEVEMEADVGDEGGERSWVGPMLIFAQLNPPNLSPNQSSSLPAATTRTDGPSHIVHLGPPGMYCSFDWEDLDAVAPWLEIKEEEQGQGQVDGAGPVEGNGGQAGLGAGAGVGVGGGGGSVVVGTGGTGQVTRRGRAGMGFD